MRLLLLVLLASLVAANRVYTAEEIMEEIQDPQLRDIFTSAFHKVQGMTDAKDFQQVSVGPTVQPVRSFLTCDISPRHPGRGSHRIAGRGHAQAHRRVVQDYPPAALCR